MSKISKWSPEWIRLRTDAQLVKDFKRAKGKRKSALEQEMFRRVALRIRDPKGLQAAMHANAKVAKKVIR